MMVTGAVPFGGSDNEAIIAKVKHDTASGNVSDTNKRLRGVLKKRDLSGDCIDFIMGLLTVDVKKRLTAQQAAKHTWLASEMIDIEGASDANRKASLHNGVTAAEMEETDDTLVTSAPYTTTPLHPPPPPPAAATTHTHTPPSTLPV